MNNRIHFLLVVAAAITFAPRAVGQGTMVRPKPESATIDSSGNLKVGELKNGLRGEVILADGSPPQELVAIYPAAAALST